MINCIFINSFNCKQHFIKVFFLIFILLFNTVNPVVNKIRNIYEGTSNIEIIGNDVFFEILDPPDLKYTYRVRPAKDFGVPFSQINELKNVQLVLVHPKYGCGIPENADEVEGNVAFVQRGYCSFKMKTVYAEKVGARAIIITDEHQDHDDYFIGMIDDMDAQDVNIPSAYLIGKNGAMIRKTLEKLDRNYAIINLPVNLTFTPIHKISQPPWLHWS